MSFIYAEKTRDNKDDLDPITIFGDTKIGFDNYSGATYSAEEIKTIAKYGMIKSTIICPEICVSFAGNNISYARDLFRILKEKRFFSPNDVVEIAFGIHERAKSDSDIEFIIASAEGNFRLDCIKSGKVFRDCQSAWIGSYEGFRELQKNRVQLGFLTPVAFRNVVEGCGDDTVGGFPIIVRYNQHKESFEYQETMAFLSSKKQDIKPERTIKFFTEAKDGGFSYSVVSPSIDCVLFSIDQMDQTILFSRTHRYDHSDFKELEGLMLPMEIIQDEKVDWIRYR